jgi:hypothetical protein
VVPAADGLPHAAARVGLLGAIFLRFLFFDLALKFEQAFQSFYLAFDLRRVVTTVLRTRDAHTDNDTERHE